MLVSQSVSNNVTVAVPVWNKKSVKTVTGLKLPQTPSVFQNAVPTLTNSEVCKICCASSGAASQ